MDCLTTTGGGAEIGICMENIPDDLRNAIKHCTIIIAKGMANFESLSETDNMPPVAYLMAAKCGPVERSRRSAGWFEDRNAAEIIFEHSSECPCHFAGKLTMQAGSELRIFFARPTSIYINSWKRGENGAGGCIICLHRSTNGSI